MPTEMTIEAAIIELNRLKTTERMDIDRERLTAAIDRLVEAARFRIKREPVGNIEGGLECPVCGTTIDDCPPYIEHFCDNCGQALDWSD
jgi:hypothetical protein